MAQPKPFQPLPWFEDNKALDIVSRSVAKTLTPNQFDEFVMICRDKGLNPLLRQAVPSILNPGERDEELVVITTIQGYRSLAANAGNYMPSDKEPKIVKRKSAIHPLTNPLGIVSATVWVKKRDDDGVWHEFSGTVRWMEVVPLRAFYRPAEDGNYDIPTGEFYLEKGSLWDMKGEMRMYNCAEGEVIRKGWPNETARAYVSEQVDKSLLAPSERVKQKRIEERIEAVSGPAIAMFFDTSVPEHVPISSFVKRVHDFIAFHPDDAQTIVEMVERNRDGFRLFWAHEPIASHELKQVLEGYRNQMTGRTSIMDRMQKIEPRFDSLRRNNHRGGGDYRNTMGR